MRGKLKAKHDKRIAELQDDQKRQSDLLSRSEISSEDLVFLNLLVISVLLHMGCFR